MSRMLIAFSAVSSLLGSTALADIPRVATDIAPVHSLVARVMDELGTPDLVVSQGASPHEYSLRPSEASALQEADLIFWIGEDLTPWLEDGIGTLASDAEVIELLGVEGTTLLNFREGALFEAHGHEHHEDHDHEEGHDGHADAKHDHDEHKHDDRDHESHAHGAHDPHAWLSPDNAALWLNAIAAALSAADPENAGSYYANAAEGIEELKALSGGINATLDPVRGGKFIVFHDAYQYFETAFEFPASGAISISDASDPSPARINEIQARVTGEGIRCVLAEPQFNPNLVTTVLDGTDARTGVLDPLGTDLELGPDLYPQLLQNLANTLADCL